ncbi:MAG: beta-L-arabinofuranosidase domain-containing protein, partial [Planctomycetota bacterium]
AMTTRLVVLVCLLPVASVALAAAEKGTPKLRSFPLTEVRLLDGPCKVAQEANRRYLHMLDFDRLLHSFRTNAGLSAPGKPLGGWEGPKVEVRGHFIGHYLSACALMHASTGDAKFKAKAARMVAELAKCQKALGGEYLAAFPESFFDRLEAGKRVWVPYYTIHKIMAGLLDMHQLCGNEQALQVLKRMAPYFRKRIDKLSIAQMDRVLRVEFGGMSEVLHDLYAVTGDPMHLGLAHEFDQAEFLGPLALEHDNLTGLHANTQIPKICGAARRYELTGDRRYRTITRYFWDRVVHTRSYATGGSNEREHWPAPNHLADTLSGTNQECCTTYNMLKVTRYLIRWTAEPQYAEFYERAYWNGILGTQDPETGMLLYFVPLGTGHSKRTGGRGFSKPYDSFWCCTGTGIESFAKLGDSIYFHDDEDLTVNLFIPSRLEWKEKGVTIEQHTRFPQEPTTTLTLDAERGTPLKLHLRIPSWTTPEAVVKVNGKVAKPPPTPGRYYTIDRTWGRGETVELRLPMALHAEPVPDDPDLMALMYGPLVLLGLTREAPHFLADPERLNAWVKPVEGQPLKFRTVGQPTDVTFRPFYQVLDEHYGVYFRIVTRGSPGHKKLQAEAEARRKRLARFLDRVVANDPESEKAHHLQGRGTQSGEAIGRGWRHARHPGWWSWGLETLPDQPMTLLCTYWGSDVPPRTFDILIDGTKIATQSLDRNDPGQFFDVEYPIPPRLTKGKRKVTVKFVPHEGNTAGGVFKCAVLKPKE